MGLRKKPKSMEVSSNCKYYYNFNYKAATKSSSNSPSTNAPLICPLCKPSPKTGQKPAFWKYNLEAHLHREHPEALESAALSVGVRRAKHISISEAVELGVPEGAVKGWREAANVPSTSDIEVDESAEVDEHGTQGNGETMGGRKRGRNGVGAAKKRRV